MGSGPVDLMKCGHTIDESLPPCLGGGSDAPSLIGAAGLGGLGLALLGGGGLGSTGAPNPDGASISI